jgi:hypothetical protein
MPQARVESIDSLRSFKNSLVKFQEQALVALGDSEAEINRIVNWLENEQDSHWQSQIRKREEIVSRCKEAVRQKQVFKDFAGRTPSAAEEEKALRIAQARLEEAHHKLAATRRWARKMQKELEVYKGSVQRFATAVQSDIPRAVTHLNNLVLHLDAYTALRPSGVGSTAPDEATATGAAIVSETLPSMARPEDRAPSPQVSLTPHPSPLSPPETGQSTDNLPPPQTPPAP